MAGIPFSTPTQVGAAIRGARIRAGITQAELAERAGVSRRWLIAVEAGDGQRAELGKVLDTLDSLDLAIVAEQRGNHDGLLDLLDGT
ncbi:helix-turn-helix domain-containing protein [Ruania alkalisoli]|uniref:helix-turn-helix domain-containing protein n=1 Tax=Ruania alkalisoli TaxID=2779775 RepID=UPI001FE5FD0F|nr:helix-turn-helix domain-containing protein [Ruania alkalisoli]